MAKNQEIQTTLTVAECRKARLFYQRNPIRFLTDCLDVKEEYIWPKMIEVAESVRDNQKTCIEAGHSVSKDYEISRLGLWFLECFGPNCTVVISGPGNNQVENVFFREVTHAYNHAKVPLQGKLTSCKLHIEDKWFMIGFTAAEDLGCDENTRTQGFHNEYVLVILTEAAGVPLSVRKAIDGLIITSKHRLVTYGNPTKAQGHFAEDAQDPSFNHINISVLDTPNYKENREIIPGLSGREFVEGVIAKYGADSNEYAIKVLGRRPEFTTGTYLGRWLARAETQKRVGTIYYDAVSPVYTVSDIGDMYSAWWFVQFIKQRIHLVDFYYDEKGIGLPGYALMLQERKYKYGGHYTLPDVFPRGSNQKSSHTGDYTVDVAHNLGIDFVKIDLPAKDEQLRMAQDICDLCWWSEKAREGFDGLLDWRKRKNEQLSTPAKPVFFDDALKTWGRHCGDAFEGLAVVFRSMEIGGQVLGSIHPDVIEHKQQVYDYEPLSLGRL